MCFFFYLTADSPLFKIALKFCFFMKIEPAVERACPRTPAAKSVIGHLEGAAGVAGLLRAALALRHQQCTPP